MNLKTLSQFLLGGSFLLALAFSSGCCQECSTESLGQFLLQPASGGWIAYTIDDTRVFENPQGTPMVLKYSPLETGFESLADGCEDLGRCGLCCDTYEGGFAFTELVSANSEFVIQIAVRKDFSRFEPTDPPSSIEDVMAISFNNTLYTEIFNLPDTTFTQNVTLNGFEHRQVYVYEVDGSNAPSPTSTPTALYFNKEDGVVGFKVADGTIWALRD